MTETKHISGIYLGNKKVADLGGSNSAGNSIDDATVSTETSYSSSKTEERLEEVTNSLIAGQESMVNLWQKSSVNVKNGDTISYITSEDNSVDKIVVQCYKFVPGEQNIVQVIKDFNNGDEENFYHSENVEFNGVAKIKDVYTIGSHLNDDGFYESDLIDRNEFLILNGIEVF